MTTVRVNLGCGPIQPADWTNVDRDPEFVGMGDRPMQLLDLIPRFHQYGEPPYPRDAEHQMPHTGLPWLDDSVDYIVMHHSIQQITHHELPAAAAEIRRVLKPGGVLRISIPDVVMAFMAFSGEDREWFPNAPGHVDDPIGVIFSTYLTWYGTNPTVFTSAYLRERLEAGGFTFVAPSKFGASYYCRDEEICALDSREPESIYLEALKQ